MRFLGFVMVIWCFSATPLVADCSEASQAYQHLLKFDYCSSVQELEEGSLSHRFMQVRCFEGKNPQRVSWSSPAETMCDSAMSLLLQGYDSLYYSQDLGGALPHFMQAYDLSRSLGGDIHKLVLLSLQEYFGKLLYTDHQNYTLYLDEYRALALTDVERAWAYHYEAQHCAKSNEENVWQSLKEVYQRFDRQLQKIEPESRVHLLGKSIRALLDRGDKKLEDALDAQMEILEQSKRTAFTDFLAVRALQHIIYIKTSQGQFDEAWNYTEDLEQYASGVDSNRVMYAVHSRRAAICDHRDQPKAAYDHLRKAMQFQAGINYQEIGKYSAAQEAQLRTLQKEKDLLQADIRSDAERRLRVRLFALMGFLGLATLVVLYRLRIKNLEKNQFATALENEQKDSQLRAINARMDGEEGQRFEIAGYLHDHVAGSLAALKVHLDVSERQFSTPLEKPRALANELGDDIRRLSHELFPSILLHRTLADSLGQLCEKYETPELNITFVDHSGDAQLDRDTRIKLYFVIKELLNNVIKHSGAVDAMVKLSLEGDSLTLQVRDDGRGFSREHREGTGLSMIRARVQSLGGILEIDGGEGCTVTISVPKQVDSKSDSEMEQISQVKKIQQETNNN